MGVAAAFAVVLLLGGCGGDEPASPTGGQTATAAAAASPSPEAAKAAAAPALRVSDLMKTLGCKGAAVIGTQMYSKETGRCTGSAGSITVAVFASDDLRDQWVSFGSQFGGNVVVGEGWALHAEGPDDAAAAATKLGGRQV